MRVVWRVQCSAAAIDSTRAMDGDGAKAADDGVVSGSGYTEFGTGNCWDGDWRSDPTAEETEGEPSAQA